MADPTPWIAAEAGPEAKKHAPATLRNRDAIADVLAGVLPPTGTVLEIASGSGEHVVHFAGRFPALAWLPSDPEPEALRSIAAWSAESRFTNILPPVALDVTGNDWPVVPVAAMLCINMVHIAPWAATIGLMTGAGRVLAPGAPLYLYGPFRESGIETAASNEAFDRSLKDRDADWGLRLVEDVAAIALAYGLELERRVAMPANNLSLVFRKRAV